MSSVGVEVRGSSGKRGTSVLKLKSRVVEHKITHKEIHRTSKESSEKTN